MPQLQQTIEEILGENNRAPLTANREWLRASLLRIAKETVEFTKLKEDVPSEINADEHRGPYHYGWDDAVEYQSQRSKEWLGLDGNVKEV